jgi:transcriptional regulator with XRE-family HTH domain
MKRPNLAQQLGQAMRERRNKLKLSQDKFADVISMHRAYYSAIERGEKNITIATLRRIATGLNATMAELLTGIE